MKKYILSIDQGTTSTRAILINERGEAVYKAQREVECLFPHPGWVESVPDKIWISVIDVINEFSSQFGGFEASLTRIFEHFVSQIRSSIKR